MHLLTTLNVDATRATAALYPGVTGLGLIAPTATLAGRAVYASKTVIRPLAAPKTGQAR